jgi:hypothetical protein
MRNKSCISALKTWLSSAFLLLSLFFVQVANAADFTWTVRNTTSPQFKTWQDACVEASKYLGGPWPVIGTAPPYTSTDTRVYCYWDRGAEGTYYNALEGFVRRQGDSCPTGTNWNPTTRTCEGDPCREKLNTSEPFSRSGVSPDGFLTLVKSSTEPPTYSYVMQQFGCFSGCKAEVDRGRSKCTARVSGPYTCRGEVIFDGTACAVSDMPAFDPTADLTLPEPTTDRETKDCVFSTGPDGVRNCQISDKTDQAGQHCGEVNGKRICFDKVPQTEETKIDRQVKDEPTPDGGTKTTQTDTKTQTKCVGNKSGCTTSTTTKTTVTTKDFNGTTTGTNTSCQGASCTSNTNPDADGDGFGDCVGDDCGDGQEDSGSEVGGEGCDVSLTCSGDAIQCAILRKQKEQTCADEDFREVTPDKVSQLKGTLDAEFSGDSYQPLVADSSNTFDFANTIDTSSRFSKSCPVVPDISVPWFEGQTLTIEFSDMISQFCDFLIWFGYLLVAFAMRAAAQIIANGMN